jgi:NAD(P)H-hydrate epimerase
MPCPVLNVEQVRAWEQATWVAGETEAEVIRRVGEQIAMLALRLTRAGDSILVLAGKGNNGKDVLSAAGFITERRINRLVVSDPALETAELDKALGQRPALILDGLFGIGLNRALSPEWIRLIERVNQSGCRVLSADVPSGLNADTGEHYGAAIRASVTLTVGAPKIGLLQAVAWPYVGRLEVASEVGLRGVPERGELRWTLPEDFSGFPPERPVDGHKGTFGHLGIIAGSMGYHGAAVLAARGAQCAQPGLVTLYTTESVYHPVAAQLQSVMVSPWLPGAEIRPDLTAIVIGPGLAAEEVPESLRTLTRRLWRTWPMPMVVDASALDWLGHEPVRKDALRVITPHPGEAARLLNVSARDVQAERLKSLRRVSQKLGNCMVVLKGHQTLVGRDMGDAFVNCSGNPHLAQGGSGDVLAGFLGGLLAQPLLLKPDACLAVRYAVWAHGAAADRLQSRCRHWTVEELVQALG